MKNLFSAYKWLLSTSFFFICSPAFAQTFTITTNNTSFDVNTAAELETVSTIASSFSFAINSGNRTYSLYTAVSATSFTPASTNFSVIPFEVKLRSITGVTTTGSTSGEIQLMEYPPGYSTLASDATKTTPSKTAVWTYDLILNPFGYTVPPGTYNFVVSVLYMDDNTSITRSFTVALYVQPVLQLNMVQNSSTTLSFNSSNQYTSGATYSGFTTHNVKSNKPWMVNVASQSTYFTPASSGADNNMPCSIVGIKPSTSSIFTPLSVSNKAVKTGNAGNSTASGNSYNVDVQFNPGYTYSAGIYNLGLTYTLTAQ